MKLGTMKLGTLLAVVGWMAISALFAPRPARADDARGSAQKVACVGDSITAGVGTKNVKTDAYPAQLARMLGPEFVVRNFGVSGSTLLKAGDKPYQKERAFKEALKFDPAIVIIMLGTNDTKPQNWKLKDQFVGDYKNLIEQFEALPAKPKIFICRPVPVPGKGNFGINEKGVQEEMPMIEEIAKDTKATIIDMHAALEGKEQMLPDRVHPNTAGATEMAKAAYKALTGKEYSADK